MRKGDDDSLQWNTKTDRAAYIYAFFNDNVSYVLLSAHAWSMIINIMMRWWWGSVYLHDDDDMMMWKVLKGYFTRMHRISQHLQISQHTFLKGKQKISWFWYVFLVMRACKWIITQERTRTQEHILCDDEYRTCARAAAHERVCVRARTWWWWWWKHMRYKWMNA